MIPDGMPLAESVLAGAVVAVGSMLALRLGLGRDRGNAWAMLGVPLGWSVGMVAAAGPPDMPFSGADLMLVAVVLGMPLAAPLDLLTRRTVTTGALIAVYGVFGAWLIAEPATPSVWAVTAAGAGTWMLIGWRLAALERDGRIPLALLIMAGSGLGGSAMLFGEEMLAIGFVLVATGAGVGLAPNWLLSQMRVLAMAWLPLTGALAAGGLLLVLRHPAALPAVLSICLIFFAETAARRLEVGSGIWRRLSVPAARLLAAAAPVAVALLAAMVGARMDVGGS